MYLFYFEKAVIVKQYTEEIIQFHFTVNCVERIVFHFFPAINHATKFPVRWVKHLWGVFSLTMNTTENS